jgi:peptidoglycan/xylan/chitin deacetylase (PgdA/CDA1 family)
VLRGVQSGSIIVLHDRGARGERTIAGLGAILPELKRRGFRVVTLSELWMGSGQEKTPRS